MNQLPEEKLHYIEAKLDRVLTYMFGDVDLDRDAQGFAMQIKNEIKEAKQELMEELEIVLKGIEADRREVKELKKKVEELEKKQIKYSVQTAIMWAALGGTVTLIVAYFIQNITKQPALHAVIRIKTFLSLLNILLWIPT